MPDKDPRPHVFADWDSLTPREKRVAVSRQLGWEQQRSTVEGTFALGRLFATPGALQAMMSAGADLLTNLARHARGDWGEVGKEDWKANDAALLGGTRLLSAYRLCGGPCIWVLTGGGRS